MSSFAGTGIKHKAELSKTDKGIRIRIDTLGAVPVELALSNVTTGIKAKLSTDHEIGDATFDEKWRIGGDAAFAVAALDESARKKLRAIQNKCVFNLEKGVFVVDAEGHEMQKAGNLVKALSEVATALSLSRGDVKKRLDGMAKNHGEAARREQAARLLAKLNADGPKPAVAKEASKGTDGALSIAKDTAGAVSKADKKKK
jgi:hypothetical protein